MMVDIDENRVRAPLGPAHVRIEAAAASHIGRRKTNADAFLLDDAAGLYAVCDGMGDGSRSREVAQAALHGIREFFPRIWAQLPVAERNAGEAKERLRMGLAHVHRRLFFPERAPRERVGTTFAGVVVCGEFLALAHVGDSRVSLLHVNDRKLTQLTHDHTVGAEALRRGTPAEEIAGMSKARALTQVLGATRHLELRPLLWGWKPGEIVLLCTNGVSDRLDADAIADILTRAGPELGAAARVLVDRAIEAGGYDNATALLVRRNT